MTDEPLILSEMRKPGEDIQAAEAEKSQPWIDMLNEARNVLSTWQNKCDGIDKLYADLDRQANAAGDREFAMFWANLQVLAPAIYTRAPVPVVSPRFSERKPLPRRAAEVLERALVTFTEESELHDDLIHARDDLVRAGRGVVWLRWDDGVHVEHLCRRDFLHEPARKWKEVSWVARAAYMTAKEVKARFKSVDLSKLDFSEKPHGAVTDSDLQASGPRKACVWEIWHKTEDRVLWVCEEYEDVLDSRAPHMKVKGFFPCPRPVYGTVQPYTLIPVPDWLYYRDQLDEINDLTARISALSDSLRVRGLIAQGHDGDVAEAVERAFTSVDNRQVLVPVPSLGGLSTGPGGGLVEWLPLDMVATTIQTLIAIRQQLISDVYEITGLSDIMRGTTNPNETLGAQQLKSQYGSIRVSERQGEMVRLGRDIYRIAAEIMAEEMSGKDLLEMAQVDDLPAEKDVKAQVRDLDKQAQEMLSNAEAAQAAGRPLDPQQLEQAQQQYQAERARLEQTMTAEQVEKFLSDEKTRPFALDIETDSTIAPDEQAEKARKTEFLTAVGGFIAQGAQIAQGMPEAAPLMAEMLRFSASAFRSSRAMDQAIDDFAQNIEQAAAQPKGPAPEQMKAEAERQAKQAELALKQQEADREDGKVKAEIALKEAQAAKAMAEAEHLGFSNQIQGQALADQQFAAALAQEGYAPPLAAVVGGGRIVSDGRIA